MQLFTGNAADGTRTCYSAFWVSAQVHRSIQSLVSSLGTHADPSKSRLRMTTMASPGESSTRTSSAYPGLYAKQSQQQHRGSSYTSEHSTYLPMFR